jgi:nitrite reductase/ring-hydroxylating ferredoxin subunit
VLVIFSVALYLKYRDDTFSYLVLAMEALGVGLTMYAGWLGGTLVYRNQVGVDIRYADAGKWKESYLKDATGKVEVCTSDELKVDQMKLIHVKDKRVVVARTEEGYVAFDDRCSHKGGSLAGGAMICGTVQCPWHGTQFDVKTGAIKAGPAKEGIKTYGISTDGNKVYLML